ncbi:hypothetical protein [Laceyella putida]|uniref:Transposase n=1 Tax=Laceyella putida TaxID=110101 RepID=A0ABW2RP46_9BACL
MERSHEERGLSALATNPSKREIELEKELKEDKALLVHQVMQIEILRKKTNWG